MSSFGEDLREERLARGVALDQITAITKISRQHLLALEQERFRLLPGGILSKGIVRGYAGALGLDQQVWTERFLQASGTAVDEVDQDQDRGWAAFASNVGKARMEQHDAIEIRVSWAGAFLLLLMVAATGFFAVRYIGVRAGWWPTLIPPGQPTVFAHTIYEHVHTWITRVFS